MPLNGCPYFGETFSFFGYILYVQYDLSDNSCILYAHYNLSGKSNGRNKSKNCKAANSTNVRANIPPTSPTTVAISCISAN